MPVCTLARARRQFILILVALFLMILGYRTAHAQAVAGPAKGGTAYVEFLIGDRTEETRKWGHVSLRVMTNGVDHIYDFGRYGAMWGVKGKSEGQPILRVWNPGTFEHYRAYHHKDGGTTRIYRFQSNANRNAAITSYFNAMTNGAGNIGRGAQLTAYIAKYQAFHAVTTNCTTVTIAAFMRGFPEYNLNDLKYAEARTLEWYIKGKAQEADYNREERAWNHVWWPLDLEALIEEKYVSSGKAQSSIL